MQSRPSVFVKAILVVDSCKTHGQLRTTYRFLENAHNGGFLEYEAAKQVYSRFAGRWEKLGGIAGLPRPLAPTLREART